jgi:hypothetical protein
MAMQSQKTLLIVSTVFLAAVAVVAALSVRYPYAEFIYPGSTIVLERGYVDEFRIFYTTKDSLEKVSTWFDTTFTRYEHYKNNAVSNIEPLCHRKSWSSSSYLVTAVICNQGDYRSVSIQACFALTDSACRS